MKVRPQRGPIFATFRSRLARAEAKAAFGDDAVYL